MNLIIAKNMRFARSPNELHFGIKCTQFLHKMFKIASASGETYNAPPDPLVGRGFLPSAIAASRLRRLHCSQFSQFLSPPKLYTDLRLWRYVGMIRSSRSR